MKQYFTLFIFLLTLIPIHAQYNVLMPVKIYKEEEKKCGLLTHDNQFAFLSYPTFSPWGQKRIKFRLWFHDLDLAHCPRTYS